MTGGPAYRTLTQPIGVDVVALNMFGGDIGDPIAAWINVDNQVVVQVVAPADRATWDDVEENQFRAAVRELAATHDLLDRTGQVSVLFDPPDVSVDDGTSPIGEIIERKR